MPIEVRGDCTGIYFVDVTYDQGSLATLVAADLSITVPGVMSTDICLTVIPPQVWNAGLMIQSARVSAANTVVVRAYNTTAGPLDPASGTWRFVLGRR